MVSSESSDLRTYIKFNDRIAEIPIPVLERERVQYRDVVALVAVVLEPIPVSSIKWCTS